VLPREGLADEHRLRFERFAQEVRDTSPRYEHLSRALATDAVAQELMAEAPAAQRRPNLLFAAVHELLLAGEDHALSRWYPTVLAARDPDGSDAPIDVPASRTRGAAERPDPADLAEMEVAFADLLRSQGDVLRTTMRTRHTQTNEVGRCAVLWPGLRRATAPILRGRPLTLIELGASAGLLLHLDRYHYVASGEPNGTPRDPASPSCCIDVEVVGEPPVLPPQPGIERRVGIDLHPLDAHDAVDVRWLAACIWPEHVERLQRLRAAVEVARHHRDVEVVRGDLVARLPEVLRTVPDATVPCVFHSATLAYLNAEERAAVADVLQTEGRRKDLVWLSFEGPFLPPFPTLATHVPDPEAAPPGDVADGSAPDDPFLLGATVWSDGARADRLLARAHPHGRWVHHLDVTA
jgi:hypothetical protein